MGLTAALIASLPHARPGASSARSAGSPALRRSCSSAALRGCRAMEVGPAPASRTIPGATRVAPAVVTPSATRSGPSRAASTSTFPRPFCSVTARPSGCQPSSERRCGSLCLVRLHQHERQPEGRQFFTVAGHSHSVASTFAVALQGHAMLPERRQAFRPPPRQCDVRVRGQPRRVPAGHRPGPEDQKSLSHHTWGGSSEPLVNSCQTASSIPRLCSAAGKTPASISER